MSFSDKVVIVTGAGSGIGAAAAVKFAKEGARVALIDLNENKLSEIAQQCKKYGVPTLTIKANINNDEETKTIVKKTIDEFGRLDVLINNAGIIVPTGTLTDGTILEAFDAMMRTNVRAAIHLTTLAVPYLAETKGSVINTSSVYSLLTPNEPQHAAYSISKAALDHFTRCAALELAASGIRVNSINPGPVKTEIVKNSGSKNEDAVWEENRQITALKRLGEPDEIAYLMLFLASDKARSITGINVVSDNGFLLKY